MHFDKVVERWPDAEALVVRHQGIRWTYSDLKREVDSFAAGLLALGFMPGDRLGIWSPNNAEWVVTQFATAKAGVILVNINPAYRPSELQYALNKLGCKGIIIASSFKTSNYAELLRSLAPEIDNSKQGELRAASVPDLRIVIRIGDDHIPGMYRFCDVAGLAGDEHRRAPGRACRNTPVR